VTRSTLDPSLLEIAATLTPASVSQFLACHDWQLEARQDRVKEIWRLPGDGGNPKARIMLPLATDFQDYSQRFYDALYAIGRLNGWGADQLYAQIIATRADLLYVRLDQLLPPDGTISFRQAETTIGAIYRMMKAAATTAADPRHSHRGRRSATVTNFLEDGVRLGHTKRGSFVFTMVTRMDDDEAESRGHGAGHDRGCDMTPFSRRVMETLAKGLETTRHLASGRDREAFDDPAEWGLSANLVESLEEMTRPQELRALDMSFEWAAAQGKPGVGGEPITFEHELFGQLARVRERLVRQEEPPRRETLVGPVKSLTREEGDAPTDEIGSVIMLADVNGRTRNVQMTLLGEDHGWAIRAYRAKLPFTVTGDLAFERGAWRLIGDIEVDTDFLRHRLRDAL
jgi:hypothetical protein